MVSIESGLEGRNNHPQGTGHVHPRLVSIESGLEGRNNLRANRGCRRGGIRVSIESGLEGRNNGRGNRESD